MPARYLAFLIAEVLIHLRSQSGFEHVRREPVEQPVRSDQFHTFSLGLRDQVRQRFLPP